MIGKMLVLTLMEYGKMKHIPSYNINASCYIIQIIVEKR